MTRKSLEELLQAAETARMEDDYNMAEAIFKQRIDAMVERITAACSEIGIPKVAEKLGYSRAVISRVIHYEDFRYTASCFRICCAAERELA